MKTSQDITKKIEELEKRYAQNIKEDRLNTSPYDSEELFAEQKAIEREIKILKWVLDANK